MVITQEFTARIDRLEAAYHKLERENTKLIEQNRRVAQESRKGSDDASAGLERWAKSAVTAATSYFSIQAAIQAVTAATRDKEEMERKARDTSLSIADAQIKALRNLGNVSTEERAKFVAGMKALSEQTKVGLQPLYLAASTGLSASAGNVPATMRALSAAARIAPESPEEMTEISGALLHMGKATRTDDAMQNLGFLLGLGQQAAVTNMGMISRNLAKGVIGVTGYGGTAKESGAILAGLTQGMPDPEGARATTAGIALAQQMEEAGLKGSPWQNIQTLRGDAKVRAEFLKKASFEKQAQIAVEQLVGVEGRGDTAWKFSQGALKAIPTGPAAAAMAEQMIGGIKEPEEQKVAARERQGKSTVEQLRLAPEGRLAALRGQYGLGGEEGLLSTLQAAGVPWFQRQVTAAGWAIPGSPVAATEHALELARTAAAVDVGHGRGSQEMLNVLDKRLAEVKQAIQEESRLLQQIRDKPQGAAKAAEQLTVGGE